MNTIALVEWHDGLVEKITIFDRELGLAFGRVYVYRKLDHEVYDVERSGLLLNLSNIESFSLAGVISLQDWISDCELKIEGAEPDYERLFVGLGRGTIKLTLTSGFVLSAEFGGAKAELVGTPKKSEIWKGPLRTVMS